MNLSKTFLFSLVLILNVFYCTSSVFDEAKLRQKAIKMIFDCKSQSKATEEDIKMIRNKKLPTTREGLCLIECLLDGLNVMENGKLNKQGAINVFTSTIKGDSNKIKIITRIVNTCEKKVGNDRCYNAGKIVNCLMSREKA
nr:general odorant-binding protein 19d [Onthophagus taurus]